MAEDKPTEETAPPAVVPATAAVDDDSVAKENAPPAVDSIAEPAAAGSEPVWPETSADHPISLLLKELPVLLESTGYDEVYGIHLDSAGPFHTKLVLQKFLRGNANDVEKAKDQLKQTLTWRKEFGPLKAKDELFSKEKFEGLGYVTVLENVPGSPNKSDVCTFNIYGAVKNNQKTFGELDE